MALSPAPGAVLDADGKPTKFVLTREFSAKPGDIITDRRGKKYSVRPDHSLRKL